MPETKYKLTERLVRILKEQRTKRGISAAKLSLDIGNSVSYISAIEKHNIKSIKESDFKKIIKILYNIDSDDLANKKIMDIIDNSQNSLSVDSIDDISDDDSINEQQDIKKYKVINPTVDKQKEFKKLLGIMNSGLLAMFKHDPKFAERQLKYFIRSMRFDLGLMSAIMGIPFFALSKLAHDERQSLYDDISSVFTKYYDMVKEDQEDSDDDSRTDSE